MERVISATEARVHFGDVMRRVSEEQATYIVERDGSAKVVLLSIEEYEELKATCERAKRRKALEDLLALGAEIRARRGGEPLPPPEQVIREMREERDAQLGLP